MPAALAKALAECDALIAKLQTEAARTQSFSLQEKPAEQGPRIGTESKPRAPSANSGKPLKAAKAGKAKDEPKLSAPSLEDTFNKAKLQVGQVAEVEELEGSDKLFRCQVKIGNGETKQILAGLRKHIAADALLNSSVVVILNLKAARLAGQLSEGMILAGVAKGESYANGELVKPLKPSAGAEAGDPVFLEGTQPGTDFPKEFKHWKKILPLLCVQGGKATFDGKVLVTAGGHVTLPSELPDGAPIS